MLATLTQAKDALVRVFCHHNSHHDCSSLLGGARSNFTNNPQIGRGNALPELGSDCRREQMGAWPSECPHTVESTARRQRSSLASTPTGSRPVSLQAPMPQRV